MKVSLDNSDPTSPVFVLQMPRQERERLAGDPVSRAIYQELVSLNQCREDSRPLIIPSGTRYEPVFRVMAKFAKLSGCSVTIDQFFSLIMLILLPPEKVDFNTDKAHRMMEQLYWLTPGGCKNELATLPEMTEADKPYLRIHKETVRENGVPKTTIILTILEESPILRRMIGAGGANIRALGELFVSTAGIHFWIQKAALPADLDALLFDEDEPEQTATPDAPLPVIDGIDVVEADPVSKNGQDKGKRLAKKAAKNS